MSYLFPWSKLSRDCDITGRLCSCLVNDPRSLGALNHTLPVTAHKDCYIFKNNPHCCTSSLLSCSCHCASAYKTTVITGTTNGNMSMSESSPFFRNKGNVRYNNKRKKREEVQAQHQVSVVVGYNSQTIRVVTGMLDFDGMIIKQIFRNG